MAEVVDWCSGCSWLRQSLYSLGRLWPRRPPSGPSSPSRRSRSAPPVTLRWGSSRSRTRSTNPATTPRRPSPACQLVGGVDYPYGIGRLEVTVEQWVAFLNSVDPAGQQRARPLQRHRELVGVAEVRPDQLLLGARAAATTRSPIPTGPTSPTASLTSCARRGSSTRSTTAAALQAAVSGRRLRWSATRSASAARPRAGCTTSPQQAHRRDPRARDAASSSPARTSGSSPPTTTPAAAAPLLLEVPDQRGRVRRRHRDRPAARPRSTPRPATSPTPPPSRWRTSTLGPGRHQLVPGAVQPRQLLERQPVRHRPDDLRRPTRAASAPWARPRPSPMGNPRPGRQRRRVDRHDHRSSLRTRAAAASGAGCTAGSPTRPPTSCGSRRSARSPQDNRFFKPTYPWLGFRIGVIGNLKVSHKSG